MSAPAEKLIKENARLVNRVNILELQLAAIEEKRALMNRLYFASRDCRAAQKCYFGNRTDANLRAARATECKLDEVLSAILEFTTQMRLSL